MSTEIAKSPLDIAERYAGQTQSGPAGLAVVMKGYPRLSETFIAQELLALQHLGLGFEIWSLRRPTDGAVHLMHRSITAPLRYLPEYLYEEPWRVAKSIATAAVKLRFLALLKVFLADLRRDATANRLRRFGQACVMACELPVPVRHIHVHYLHTPASVVRYTAILRGLTWSFSAHAKDIWTTPDWEKAEKIADAAWGVTCTMDGLAELGRLSDRKDAVRLVYHGLDLTRFPPAPVDRQPNRGKTPDTVVELITIGRAVEKKGFDDLIAALALLPTELNWHLTHIGGGEHLSRLMQQATLAGLSSRISWLGAQTQSVVIEKLRAADIFILPSKEAASGDRDGLPNVVMEAASQALPIIATDFAGIPEFVRHDVEGLLCQPSDLPALSAHLAKLITHPVLRERLGQAALVRLKTSFSTRNGIKKIYAALQASLAKGRTSAP
jgi:glycosyltransferase involved in cell wall biosynthesis